eukprot:6247209-Pyramimonas_sp.AAC.1
MIRGNAHADANAKEAALGNNVLGRDIQEYRKLTKLFQSVAKTMLDDFNLLPPTEELYGTFEP